jgi:hypothetical protein
LGAHVKSKIAKRAKATPAIKNTIDSVYVLYVVSSGVVSDFSDVYNTLNENEWCSLPLQIQVISCCKANADGHNLLLKLFNSHNKKVSWA